MDRKPLVTPPPAPRKNVEPVIGRARMMTCILMLEESTDGFEWKNGILG